MLHTKIRINSGINIVTLGAIAIAIASFLKDYNAKVDISLFLFSGIFLILSGIVYLMCNVVEIPDLDIEKEIKSKNKFLPIAFIKRGYFGFVTSRAICVGFLFTGSLLFLFATVNLFEVFAVSINLGLKWGIILFLMLIYAFLLPATYKDFE